MAVSASDTPTTALQSMEEELTCSICYELLEDPRDLDCPHVFCLSCLEDWVRDEHTIECPECRHITRVPPGGLINLKTNLRLRNIVGKYAAPKTRQKSVPICKTHEGERQHFFCVTCGVMVCQACLVIRHKRPKHKIKELQDISKQRKSEMNTTLDALEEKVTKITNKERQLQEMEKQVRATIEKEKQKADKHLREIVANAQELCLTTKERIQKIGSEKLEEIRKQAITAKKLNKRLSHAYATGRKIVSDTPDHLYVMQHVTITDKMKRLSCSEEKTIPDPTLEDLCFHSSSVIDDKMWFGHIGTRVHKLSLCTEFGFGTFRIAQAVAVSKHGLLAVVDSKAQKIHAYRNVSGEFVSQFISNATNKPVNIAALENGKFLVAESISVGGAVKVLSPTGQYEKTFSHGQGTIVATCVTRDGEKILLGNIDSKTISVWRPDSSEGQLVTILHDSDIQRISTNYKHIALSDFNNDSVYFIDLESGQKMLTLKIEKPLGVCFDDQSGSLLVSSGSDLGKGVIEQYCSTTGRLMARLASRLTNPLGMTLMDDSKLVVADRESVKVYDIE